MTRVVPVAAILLALSGLLRGAEVPRRLDWPYATVDLDVGQSANVELPDGRRAAVKLLRLTEVRDQVRHAVREVQVTVEINGKQGTPTSANYRLPIEVGGVQVDCSVARGCVQPGKNPWALHNDARLRLWPLGPPGSSPARSSIRCVSAGLPAPRRWPTSRSSSTAAKSPTCGSRSIIIGGSTPAGPKDWWRWWRPPAGVVVTAGKLTLPAKRVSPGAQAALRRGLFRDDRGWYYRYSHLFSFDAVLRPGLRVAMGQKIGLLGKEGASGGWSHLHFDITTLQPNGEYGIADAYAFYWQASCGQYPASPGRWPGRITWPGPMSR